MKTKNKEVRNMMSFGEAADANLMGGGKKFPVAMAEKRAMSRVVLKIADSMSKVSLDKMR